MAYATAGSGGTLIDLMDALRVFALAQGWTVDKWDAANRLLFMTKGQCAITMKGYVDNTVRIYSGANGSNIFTDGNPDHRLYFALNSSNTAALTTYHNHPGSIVTSEREFDSPYVNGLQGPFVAWHFFSDPAVGDHIHCVVQIKAEVFVHFSFGHLDKKGLTHNGVAYVTAMGATYWRNVSNYTAGSTGSFNDPQWVNHPFMYCNGNSGHTWGSFASSPGIILKNTNAWPAAWYGPIAGAAGSGNNFGSMLRLIHGQPQYRPEQFPGAVGGGGGLLDLLTIQEPTTYSNVSPLFPLPVFKFHYNNLDQNSRRICYVGDFPNVRAINLTNLQAGQEISVNADTYMVFPHVRKSSWNDRNVDPQPQSGQHGIAYKKVA